LKNFTSFKGQPQTSPIPNHTKYTSNSVRVGVRVRVTITPKFRVRVRYEKNENKLWMTPGHRPYKKLPHDGLDV